MRQILRLAGAPEVGEIEVRMLADHMAVQRHDVDTRLAQRMQDRLHFLGTHDEVAVHCRECIAATERSPGRQAHRSADHHALHRAAAPDRDLGHALAIGRRLAHDLAHRIRVDATGRWRCATKARRRLRVCAAHGANRAPNRLDARCQGFGPAFSPKLYFMHTGGEGRAETLAAGVKAGWGASRAVRSTHAQPATSFGGATPAPGHVDADAVSKIVGQPATDSQGVAKVTIGRTGTMQGMVVGASMGLTTWAAFSGSDALAAMDGDFIMSAEEVQPVLHALRKAGVHIVALHSHMLGEHPNFYFTHFWSTGKAQDLAHAFRTALDAQAAVGKP